jgi:gliding motility-associated-like protein
MRPIRYVLLLVMIIAITAKISAQTVTQCDGSLGDPVISEDFGSGQNPGPALPSATTNMQYTSNPCPSDGQYTIANSLDPSCHSTWQNVSHDHTGNPNGYMMIVNASETPSVFFTQSAPTLCPGTTYQFSAWILNLITQAASGPGVSEPNITFTVSTQGGQVLAIDSSGTIEPTATATWVQKSLFFTTPDTVTSVVVTMTNNAPGGNGNDLILDDITFRACGPLIETGFATATGSQSQPLCQGDNATYTLQADAVGVTDPHYQWQVYDNGGWVDTAGQNSNTLVVNFINAAVGTYQYRVGITNGPSALPGCRVYSSPISVTVTANPVVTGLSPTVQKCTGDTLTLTAYGGATYQWNGPNINTTQNPLIITNVTAANSGQYTVTAYSQYDCTATASTQVTVNPLPTVTVAGSTTICAGNQTNISATGGVAYTWSPGATLSDATIANPVASPIDTTVYHVKVFNQFGCYATDSVTVNVEKKAIAKAGSNKVIFEGQSVKLNGSEQYGGSYYWTPDSAISDPNSLTPVVNPTNSTIYTLHVTSANSCGDDSSSVFIKVYKTITIPNTFSPNGDGINDLWNIEALVTYPDCLLQVFDRYGQQVYKSTGYNKAWDGRYNGQVLPPGTYYYVLDLRNDTPKISGWVLIVK